MKKKIPAYFFVCLLFILKVELLAAQPGIVSITLAMVIVGWISMARIVRAQILKLKTYEFVLASRTLGA
ncbi:MAG: ABC transporter permease subunit, partial [Panacibacter sp.]